MLEFSYLKKKYHKIPEDILECLESSTRSYILLLHRNKFLLFALRFVLFVRVGGSSSSGCTVTFLLLLLLLLSNEKVSS